MGLRGHTVSLHTSSSQFWSVFLH